MIPVDRYLPFHSGDQLVHHNILRHSLGREQSHVHFLINNLNAQLFCDAGVTQLHHVSIQQNLPGVAGICARQNLHQRGFARAVGAYHRPHISCFDGEVYIGERFYTGELYGYVPGFNSDFFHGFPSFSLIVPF